MTDEHSRTQDEAELAVLAVVNTEFEARLLVDALLANDIHAEPSGVVTGGFRAEAPGRVKVLVRADQLQNAIARVREYRKEMSEIDWSKVDVGDRED